jgi:hypothetical protein
MSGKPCKERSGINFKKFVDMIKKKPGEIHILLARALLNNGDLDKFTGQTHASECVFSYPDSDWFGVYMLDESGNKVWNSTEGSFMKFYFKIKVNTAGTNAAILEDTMTYNTPDELKDDDGNEISHCVLRGTKCGDPEDLKIKKLLTKKEASAKPKAVKSDNVASTSGTKRVPKEKVEQEPVQSLPPQVSPALLAQLQDFSISGGETSSSSSTRPQATKISREYFEQMKNKEMIVDWMIKNMDPKVLINCIKKGSLSQADLQDAERIAGMEVPETSIEEELGELSLSDLNTLEVARSLPPAEVKSMLQKVTKETISELINKVSDADQKKKAIVELCKRAGINNYSTGIRRNKLRLIDQNGETVDEGEIDEIIDECAKREATKLRRKLVLLSYVASKPRTVRQDRQPVIKKEITRESIINEINSLGADDKKNAIVELCKRNDINKYSTGIRRNKLRLIDQNGETVDEGEIDEILMECVELEYSRVNQFGRIPKRKVFKTRKNNKRKY